MTCSASEHRSACSSTAALRRKLSALPPEHRRQAARFFEGYNSIRTLPAIVGIKFKRKPARFFPAPSQARASL